jgi:hypothetical protein
VAAGGRDDLERLEPLAQAAMATKASAAQSPIVIAFIAAP